MLSGYPALRVARRTPRRDIRHAAVSSLVPVGATLLELTPGADLYPDWKINSVFAPSRGRGAKDLAGDANPSTVPQWLRAQGAALDFGMYETESHIDMLKTLLNPFITVRANSLVFD